MTNKTKHRHQNRVQSPSQSTAAPTGNFHMVAAANPGPSLNVGPELELIKAALLYGDKVTIISPLTTMLLRAEGLQRFNPRQLLEPLRRVAPFLLPANELPGFGRGLAQVDQLLQASPVAASLTSTSVRPSKKYLGLASA